MKNILTLIAIICTTSISFSQSQYGAYTAVGKGVATTFLNDYQSLGINSSALGWGTGFEGKKITMGTSEFSVGLYSTALTKDKMKNLSRTIRQSAFGDDTTQTIDWMQQREAAAEYAEQGLAINANYNWFGASYQGEKFGGIAIQVREKYDWFSQLNKETSDLIFRGKLANYFDSLTVVFGNDTTTIANRNDISNDTLQAAILGEINNPLLLSKITEGTKIKMRWDREWNIGYGRKLFGNPDKLAVYAGIAGRYIQSMALFDFESNGSGITLNSSVSPTFNINYGTIANTNPSAVKQQAGNIPKKVGEGYGFDISGSVKMAKIFTFAASVNNIGSVTYNKNVYEVKDTLLGSISLRGLDDASITESINQLLKGDGILKLVGKEKFVVKNASTFRLGGSVQPIKQINVGIDIVAPFDANTPGSLQNAIFSVGGDFRPIKWLQISAGYYGGGVYKNNIPVGINFILKNGTYEFGISSADAITFFSENSNSLSTAFGFARFRL